MRFLHPWAETPSNYKESRFKIPEIITQACISGESQYIVAPWIFFRSCDLDSLLFVLPGSELSITDITEYRYFGPLKPCRQCKYEKDYNTVPLDLIISHGFEHIDPQSRVLNYCFQ